MSVGSLSDCCLKRTRELLGLPHALFLDMTVENADQRCSTFLPPQRGQEVFFSLSWSAMVKILEKIFLHAWQKNS
jgi:hypothetical protein